ncbi:MAG: M48 family metalloprotease [Solirubrobacteraceae bacterium]|nr:M48 family metalloprotease [Solirubrobacteraceae bacterium]
MLGERLRLPAAVLAAVLVAELAVLVLWPRDGVIEPAPVSAPSYFSASDLQQARDFRRPQLLLVTLTLVIETGVLIAIVARPPRRLRDARRPVLAAAAGGASIAVALDVATLPVRAVLRERAIDVGLVTQSWSGWASDVALSGAIGAAIAAVGAAGVIALMRRFPRRWWVPAAGVIVAYGVITIYLAPIVLDPRFNTFTDAPPEIRAEVLALAEKAGVDVGEVQVMDASRRTTAANAYVAGLGSTKRVVLYDTLLEDFEPDEVRSVIAHELAHERYHDLRNGLLYLAIVAPFGMFAAAQLARRLAPEPDDDGRPRADALPAVALSVVLVAAVIGVISNQLSRQVEARADTFALTLTDEPASFIRFKQRLAVQNVSDPEPPAVATFLWGTHPPVLDRIGAGVAYERGAR